MYIGYKTSYNESIKMSTTGSRFKKIRTALNLSQEVFGKNIGLSKSGISAVENDKTFVSLDILTTLFIDYNINLNYLVCGAGTMFNPSKPLQQDDFTEKVKEILRAEGLIR